jgi:RNA polymerase sigma factor (sigma-70 family)
MAHRADRAPTDAERCAERLRDGDEAALDQLIQQQWWPLIYYVSRQVQDQDLAEDVVQEAFLRLWANRRKIPIEALVPYLYTIVRHVMTDHLRRASRRERILRDRARGDDDAVPLEPARDSERAELRTAMTSAIDELPARRREAFVLVHVLGHSYKEAAAIMGIQAQTVADQVSAALFGLRAKLRGMYGDRIVSAREPRSRGRPPTVLKARIL